MAHADLCKARECYEKIRDLIVRHPGGWQDNASLAALRLLCRAAAAIDDGELKTPLASVEHYATDLFSPSAHEKWARRSTSGATFLRLQILRELESFRARLLMLEAARDAALRSAISSPMSTPRSRRD